MKTIYKVLSMNCHQDEEYFFTSKKLAIRFLAKTMRDRENHKPFPDRDGYDIKMENKIWTFFHNKKWEELAPIFALYLYEVPLNSSLKNVKVMDGKQNE